MSRPRAAAFSLHDGVSFTSSLTTRRNTAVIINTYSSALSPLSPLYLGPTGARLTGRAERNGGGGQLLPPGACSRRGDVKQPHRNILWPMWCSSAVSLLAVTLQIAQLSSGNRRPHQLRHCLVGPLNQSLTMANIPMCAQFELELYTTDPCTGLRASPRWGQLASRKCSTSCSMLVGTTASIRQLKTALWSWWLWWWWIGYLSVAKLSFLLQLMYIWMFGEFLKQINKL